MWAYIEKVNKQGWNTSPQSGLHKKRQSFFPVKDKKKKKKISISNQENFYKFPPSIKNIASVGKLSPTGEKKLVPEKANNPRFLIYTNYACVLLIYFNILKTSQRSVKPWHQLGPFFWPLSLYLVSAEKSFCNE